MNEQLQGGDEMMEKNRKGRPGSALAVLLSLGLAAACEDPAPEEPAVTPPGQTSPGQMPPGQAPMVQPQENGGPPRAYEQPGQTPPGQAPVADPGEPPAEGGEEAPSR